MIMRLQEDADNTDLVTAFNTALTELNGELKARGTTYLGGEIYIELKLQKQLLSKS